MMVAYTRSDGGLSIITPSPGARLAFSITLADGTILPAEDKKIPQPVDNIKRGWPISGATAQWAESEDQFMARIVAKDVPPDATDVSVIDASAIPERTFRGAWRKNGATISHDMAKARSLMRDMLRAERSLRFNALDGQWMRAVAKNDTATAAAIEAKREILRNWPTDQRIAAATSGDDLFSTLKTMLSEN